MNREIIMLATQIIKVSGIFSHEAGRQIKKGPVLHYLPRAFVVGAPVPIPGGYLKGSFRPSWVPAWVSDGAMITVEGDYVVPRHCTASVNACWTMCDIGIYINATCYVWDTISDRIAIAEAISVPESILNNYR